jgi:serine/threonine protein kinase/predicted ATPase
MQENISARYQKLERLGVGSMGSVYRVFDRLTAQTVALKLVNTTLFTPGLMDTAMDFRLALAHEFQILASLRHPHIISVLDYGFDPQGQPYFTMELLLDHMTILEAGVGLSVPRKIRLVVQMLQALLYLHRRGILHRDLKPANALVASAGGARDRLRLLDFGLAIEYARWKDSDVISGTPAYIAPEVLMGNPPSTASDLYSVGIIIHELLTGRHPFDTSNLEQLIFDVMNTAPNLNALVTQLNLGRQTLPETGQIEGDDLILKIVRKLLEKKPEHRYHDAAEVIHDLSRALGEPLPVETSETRESFLQASCFVGRETELTQLNDALTAAFSGKGSLWFVHGESGVGKSRLMNEFRAKALVKGALVVRGQAEAGLPYQIWREPLRRLALEVELNESDAAALQLIVTDIDKLLNKSINPLSAAGEETAQERIGETVISLLQKLKKPVVILLEDVHLMRSESLGLLYKIAEIVGDNPVLIAGSYRDDESPNRFNQEFPAAHRIKLQRLRREDIDQLSQAMLGARGKGLVDSIHRETEGNAFFLIEIMRALAEEAGQLDRVGEAAELPKNIFTGGVQRIVQRRLNRVPRSHYPLLQVAAALGRQIDLRVLQAAAPEVDLQDWLLTCASAAVLELQDNEWYFAHDKVREGVNITLNYEQLAAVHRKAAAALESVYPDDPRYATSLMNHWFIVGDAEKERRYTIIAGDHAYFVGANPEALQHYRRALELVVDPKERLALNNKLSAAQIRLGLLDDALTLLQRTLEQAQDSSKRDPRLIGSILSNLGNAYLNTGNYQEAAQAFRRSLALFLSVDSQKDAAFTLIHLGHVYANRGDYVRAEDYFEQSLAILRRAGARWGVGQALNALGRIKAAKGEFAEANRILNEALTIHRALHNRDGIVSVSFNLGTLAAIQGQFDEAERWLRESLQSAREIGAKWNIAAALSNLGMIALDQQRYSEAREQFMQSLTLLEGIGDQFAIANTYNSLGRTLTELNEAEKAMKYLKDGLRLAHQIGATPLVLEALTGIAALKHRQGNNAEAMKIIRMVLRHHGVNAEIEAMAKPLSESIRGSLSADEAEATFSPEPLEGFIQRLAASV